MLKQRLKKLRESNGFSSQEAFADAFGVSLTEVENWESGKCLPDSESIKRLSLFYNINEDYFLCVPGNKNLKLSDKQQKQIFDLFSKKCNEMNITTGFSISQSKASSDFFHRLEYGTLHKAIEYDLYLVATFLNVDTELLEITEESFNKTK